MKDTEKIKNQFLNSISHNFKTPLNGIIGFLDSVLLQPEYTMSSNTWNLLEYVNKNAHILLNMVLDLIDYSKINAN